MLRRWRAEIIAFAVAIAPGLVIGRAFGVGGWGVSEEQRVRDAAVGYLHAYAEGDALGVCQRVSPRGRLQLEYGVISCEDGAQRALARLPREQRARLRGAEVTAVSVSGRRATARFTPALGDVSDMRLIKLEDRWLVDV
jgi:hypothetical protein